MDRQIPGSLSWTQRAEWVSKSRAERPRSLNLATWNSSGTLQKADGNQVAVGYGVKASDINSIY